MDPVRSRFGGPAVSRCFASRVRGRERMPSRAVRKRFGASDRRACPPKNSLPIFGLVAPRPALPCPVNPQVPGSSPGRGARKIKALQGSKASPALRLSQFCPTAGHLLIRRDSASVNDPPPWSASVSSACPHQGLPRTKPHPPQPGRSSCMGGGNRGRPSDRPLGASAANRATDGGLSSRPLCARGDPREEERRDRVAPRSLAPAAAPRCTFRRRASRLPPGELSRRQDGYRDGGQYGSTRACPALTPLRGRAQGLGAGDADQSHQGDAQARLPRGRDRRRDGEEQALLAHFATTGKTRLHCAFVLAIETAMRRLAARRADGRIRATEASRVSDLVIEARPPGSLAGRNALLPPIKANGAQSLA